MIHHGDCLECDLPDLSVDLGIHDPPFGIGEGAFNQHYKRDASKVIGGYREAPKDYESWTEAWLRQAVRVLKDDGSMYVFMGHSNLRALLNAAHKLGLHEINHCIWKYNFGVYTKNKYVTSHYHVLFYKKHKASRPVFNTNCRFGSQEKAATGGSLLYQDLEDVFVVPRDYAPSQRKNQNKLPEGLIKKLILYSSSPGDLVCDFFLGNFTTAYAALKLGRRIAGYEVNKNSYDYHVTRLKEVKAEPLPLVRNVVPTNQGKKVEPAEAAAICADYRLMLAEGVPKGEASELLQEKYGRGRFSIKNILDKHLR